MRARAPGTRCGERGDEAFAGSANRAVACGRCIDGGLAIGTELDVDLVGISAITHTDPRAYDIANRFRDRGVPVVLGGVHRRLMPDEATRHADCGVTGCAEGTPQLMLDHDAGALRPRYDQARAFSLAGRRCPKRELLPGTDHALLHTIEATRGCIHRCDFCVAPSAWGQPLQRPVCEAIDDIRQMGARRLVFVDLNPIADVAYAKELFSALIPIEIAWSGLATTLIARDPELLDLAARSGCRDLLLGFECGARGASSRATGATSTASPLCSNPRA
ncbi:MAG: hypothetical protein EA416_00455 [Trueperaceae bacterium]|nr:MAG: hypothetical protein EA416_00455 [Trueperaceae bacterium]